MDATRPKILLVDEFIPEHMQLFNTLQSTVSWDTSMSARKTASFGEPYNYSQMTYPATPMHTALESVVIALKDRLDILFNNCLLNFYPSGNSTMGFHSDDTSSLRPETGVAIVSLGNARDITYRSKTNKDICCSFTLQPGSMLYMDSDVQDYWMHAIKKTSEAGPRISLTWRAFATID